MKKMMILMTAFMFFAATSFASDAKANGNEKSSVKKEIVAKKAVNSGDVCSSRTSITAPCPPFGNVEIGVFTVFFDCNTQRIINTDFWQSGNTCASPQNFIMD